MKKVYLSENLSVSQIIFGVWRLMEWKMDAVALDKLIRQNLALGITTFDHADIYGNYECEEAFGKLLKADPSLRRDMQLVTKCGIMLKTAKYPVRRIKHYDTSKAHIIYSVENSLKRLATDHIDLLLIHRPDPFMDPEEVATAFSELLATGKVLNFGVSNFSTMQYDMLQSYLDFDLVTNQVEVSLACLDAFKDGTIAHAMKHRKPLMAWSPLAGGNIFTATDDRSVRIKQAIDALVRERGYTADQWLLAWLLAHPAGILPILGTGKVERVTSAIGALGIKMTREEWFMLLAASEGKEVP